MVDGEPLPVAPPWEKGVNRFASVWGSCWCPRFGRRPRCCGEIVGERRLGREEEEPDMRVLLSVTQRLPPLFYSKSRFFAILQK